ncbi:hypothetical protein P261_02850 [Lachnospiraceae bacterium TWA4]|nr:hypothetical protein P261_02850 [Lachnospiraceae bacterium TWA4]
MYPKIRIYKTRRINKSVINNDISVDITSGMIVTDSGCSDFFYNFLQVDNGTGEFISFNSNDSLEDDSELLEWAKENGYYDEEFDDYNSEFICEPPFEEMSKSYEGVYRVDIVPNKDEN